MSWWAQLFSKFLSFVDTIHGPPKLFSFPRWYYIPVWQGRLPLCRPCRYFFSWPYRQFSPSIYFTVRDLYLFNATFVGSICLRAYAIVLSYNIFLRLGQLPAAVTLPTILVVCLSPAFSNQPIFGGQRLKSRPICLRTHCLMGAPFFSTLLSFVAPIHESRPFAIHTTI